VNQDLQSELSELAEKLGVSVEHLWEVLKRQAFIDGLSSLLTMIVCLVLAAIAIFGFALLQRKYAHVSNKELGLSMWPPPEYARWLLLSIVLLFLLLMIGTRLYWVISDFSNPEYFAWREIRR
jgi:hypothetical protein